MAKALHTRAPSALFDIELDDSSLISDKCVVAVAELKSLLLSNSKTQKQLLRDAEQALEIAVHGNEVDLRAFAEVLASKGHLVCLRTGRPDKFCPQVSLRHSFVVAGVAGCHGSATISDSNPGSTCSTPTATQLFVLDPSFRDQFLLSNATRTYQALCDELPTLFVGTAEQLVPLVEFMCKQMETVFKDTASSCPPWRTASCMVSKWLPSSAEDTPVLPGSTSNSSRSGTAAGADCIVKTACAGPAAAALAFGSAITLPSSAYDGMRRTTSDASTTSTSINQPSSEFVYTPRASKAPYYAENDSSGNVLLSGSLVGLGSSYGPFADADVADVAGNSSYCGARPGEIRCIVYSDSSPSSSPGSWRGKPGYLGAATWSAACENSIARPRNGLAIKTTPRVGSCTGNHLISVAAQREEAQQQLLRKGVGVDMPGVSPRSPLDISRFDNDTAVDMDLIFSPRSAKSAQQLTGQQLKQPGSASRRPGLFSQRSALSAAIANTVV